MCLCVCELWWFHNFTCQTYTVFGHTIYCLLTLTMKMLTTDSWQPALLARNVSRAGGKYILRIFLFTTTDNIFFCSSRDGSLNVTQYIYLKIKCAGSPVNHKLSLCLQVTVVLCPVCSSVKASTRHTSFGCRKQKVMPVMRDTMHTFLENKISNKTGYHGYMNVFCHLVTIWSSHDILHFWVNWSW